MDCLDLPRATKVDCPTNCKDMNIKAMKYMMIGILPISITLASDEKIVRNPWGKIMIKSHINAV